MIGGPQKLFNGTVPTPAFLTTIVIALFFMLSSVQSISKLLPWTMADKLDQYQSAINDLKKDNDVLKTMIWNNTVAIRELTATIKADQKER